MWRLFVHERLISVNLARSEFPMIHLNARDFLSPDIAFSLHVPYFKAQTFRHCSSSILLSLSSYSGVIAIFRVNCADPSYLPLSAVVVKIPKNMLSNALPRTFHASSGILYDPIAFPFFIFLNALTSSIVMFLTCVSALPPTTPQSHSLHSLVVKSMLPSH